MVSAKKLTGINPLAYMGVEPSAPPQLVAQPFPPTPADVQNNNIGTLWIVPGSAVYMLIALAGNTATWVQIYPASGSTTEFDTDAGFVFPAGGIVNVSGGTNINTSGAGNTITINLDTDITVGNFDATGTVTFDSVGNGVLQADAFGVVTGSVGTDGQVLIAATGGTPAWADITSNDASVTITEGANSIDLSVAAGGGITTLDGDSGSATGATVTIAGGSNITTSAAVATVTVDLDSTVSISGSMTAGTGFSATTGDVQIVAGNLVLPDTTSLVGQITLGTTLWGSNFGGNTFIGNAGNTTTATLGDAIGIGSGALAALGAPQSDNIAIGNLAGAALVNSNENIFIGGQAGNACTGGINVMIGQEAGLDVVSGSGNVLLGETAGSNYTGAESFNIVIGAGVNGTLGETRAIHIGDSGFWTSCSIGGIFGSTVDAGTGVPVVVDSTGLLGTVVSSRRFKENIEDMGLASSDILKLRPVTFTYIGDKSARAQPGLIAEEVEEVMPGLVIHQDERPFSVRYDHLPVLLLNEVKRLSKVCDSHAKYINRLERKLAALSKLAMCDEVV